MTFFTPYGGCSSSDVMWTVTLLFSSRIARYDDTNWPVTETSPDMSLGNGSVVTMPVVVMSKTISSFSRKSVRGLPYRSKKSVETIVGVAPVMLMIGMVMVFPASI